MVGDRVFYTCDPGYHLVGHSPITCQDQPGFALWDDEFPYCVNKRRRSKAYAVFAIDVYYINMCTLMYDVTTKG